MEILDFSSFALFKIARKLYESTDLNLFLAFGGCEEWLNGSVENDSSFVIVKIYFSSSIKKCTAFCLRDDLSDNSRGEGSSPVYLSIYSVLPFWLKTRWICNVIVNSINQWDVDSIIDACAASARLNLVMLCKSNLNEEAHLYFTFSQTFKISARDFDKLHFYCLINSFNWCFNLI